jgi:hypothetical protein
MLLNIRDIMTLSDPRDPTKPNPWSLDPSFDIRYGLGGMNEITLEHIGDGNGEGSDAGNNGANRRAQGGKLKARDEEEPGADAVSYDRDIMLGLGGLGDGTASVFSGSNVYGKSPLQAPPSSTPPDRGVNLATTLDFSGTPEPSVARRNEDLEKGKGPGTSSAGSSWSRSASASIAGAGSSGSGRAEDDQGEQPQLEHVLSHQPPAEGDNNA